jgi:hypothetical protein
MHVSRRNFLAGIAAPMVLKAGVCENVRTFHSTADGSEQPYAFHAPANVDAEKRLPLVVSLHGAGQDHHAGLRHVLSGGPAACYVAAPFGRGSMGYDGIAETDVYDVVDDVSRRFRVDPDRVYLTGVSMGGSGTLSLALRRPDVWAAIAPVCGGAPEGLLELAVNASNLPTRMRHGDQDETVPIAVARHWKQRFADAGTPLDYEEYAGAGHNIAARAYGNGATLHWLLKQRRIPYPSRVQFSTREQDRASAYWVQVDRMKPGSVAGVDARLEGNSTVRVRTSATRAFTLRLDKHPHAGEQLDVIIDAQSPLKLSRRNLSFALSGSSWEPADHPQQARRRAGLDGPFRAVISTNHAYVYGTAEAEGSHTVWERQEVAQRAADWAGWKARPAVSFPVLADTDAPASQRLVVFGTRRTNRLLQKWSPQLPLHLREEAAGEFGLAFVYPLGDRLIAVNSGLPWWTGASRDQREGFRYQWLSLPYRLALGFPDYVLFRRSITNILHSGYFEDDWSLPAEAAGKLRGTGVVGIGT